MTERKDEQLKKEVLDSKQEELRRAPKSERFVDRILPRDRASAEVEDWLTKIEKDPQQIKNQQMGNTKTNLQAVASKPDDTLEIPISRGKFVSGFKEGVSEVARWLSVFWFRVIKKRKIKVKFSEEET